jgi:regulator of replication initiation timing
MRDLIIEVGELKERVAYLEKSLDNRKSEGITAPNKVNIDDIKLAGEGYNNLGAIYNQGYHICPMAYGQLRTGECLFCIAFLEKE